MEIESIDIRPVENGWIISMHTTSEDSEGNKEWDSEEFVYLEKVDALAKLNELMKAA